MHVKDILLQVNMVSVHGSFLTSSHVQAVLEHRDSLTRPYYHVNQLRHFMMELAWN